MFDQINLRPNAIYSIYSAMDKSFVLDCSQSNDPSKKFNACLWKSTGDLNQKFYLNKLPNGFYEII